LKVIKAIIIIIAKFTFKFPLRPPSLSKDWTVVDKSYGVELSATSGVLTFFFLVLANLQTMADTLILPSCREHPQTECPIAVSICKKNSVLGRPSLAQYGYCTCKLSPLNGRLPQN